MKAKSKILWITQTAIFLALLIVAQSISQVLGQFVTGSLVNLILITATLLVGVSSGGVIALISPIFAFILGIGPNIPQVVICIMLGNLALVLVWHFIAGKAKHLNMNYFIAWIAAAVVKFGVLYIGVVQFVVKIVAGLKEQQIKNLTTMFSFPQLITALIGGFLAILVVPILKKALKKSKTAN